jgi:hypothetical protein
MQPPPQNTDDAVCQVYSDALEHPDPAGDVTQWTLAAVLDHARQEATSIETYRRLGVTAEDPAIRAAMSLLVAEEEHHHQLFQELAVALRDTLEWRTIPVAPSAAINGPNGGSPGLAHELGGLAAEERRTAHELRELAYAERMVNAPVPSLLLECLAMDSDKHARLLTLLQRRVASPPPSQVDQT